MSPLVSVVVPAFNAASTIEETLRSALQQSLKEIEVIVVDDGSTDETAAIVEAMAASDPRLRLLRQANSGVAAARNTAIAAAAGTYIAPLDADDLWYADKLKAQVARVQAGGDQMGMVYSWPVTIDSQSRVIGWSFPCFTEGDARLQLRYVNLIGCASVPLIRRSALRIVGNYDESLREADAQGCEDWDLSLRIAARYDVGVAPGHSIGYRQASGSMSMDTGAMYRSYRLVMDRLRSEIPHVSSDVDRWSEAHFAAYLATQSYRSGHVWDAIRWVGLALRKDPAYALSLHPYGVVVLSIAHRLGAGALADAVQAREMKGQMSLEDIQADEGTLAGETPWHRSKGLYDRIRARRWDRIRRRWPAWNVPRAGRTAPPRVLTNV